MGDAAPVILTVVAVAASVVAGPEMGAAILGYSDAIEAVAAGYSVSTLTAVSAASLGAASGAISEAQKTGDPGKILKAAGVGAAAGAVGSEAGSAFEGAPAAVKGASQGAASGFTGAQLSGQNLQQSVKSGEVGGVTGGVVGGLSDLASGAGVPKDVASPVLSAAGPYIRQDVSNIFGGTQGATGAGTGGTTGQAVPSYLTSGPLSAGGSAVLGSQIGGGGTDISPPVQVGSEPTASRNAWVNQASLREADQSGGVA